MRAGSSTQADSSREMTLSGSSGYGTIDRSAAVTVEGTDTPTRSRIRLWRLCSAGLCGFLVFIPVILILILNISVQYSVPSPSDKAVASKTALGVGIDLTPSYGTVAIRYENGSTIDVAKIEADTDYQDMMRRFSVGGKQFDSMWQDYCGRMFDYSWPRILKMLRKRLGLPSTKDVARLKGLIAKLHLVAEERAAQKISAAVITTPSFPALCKDDIVEAAKLDGLLPLTDRRLTSQPKELNGAFFGAGFGHCANYTNLDSCNAEENAFPVLGFLYVSFSNVTLFLRRSSMRKPYDGTIFEENILVDYRLGSNAIPNESQKAQAFWSHVSDRIRQLCGSPLWSQYSVEKVLLFGESAGHLSLKDTLNNTITQSQDTPVDFVQQEPLYIVARGAAQFAKRAQEDWAAISQQPGA